jgi:hypothetical protein
MMTAEQQSSSSSRFSPRSQTPSILATDNAHAILQSLCQLLMVSIRVLETSKHLRNT